MLVFDLFFAKEQTFGGLIWLYALHPKHKGNAHI